MNWDFGDVNPNFASAHHTEGIEEMYTALTAPQYLINKHTLASKSLKRKVAFEIYLPDNLLGNETLNLLLLNDGQDAEALGLLNTLTTLYNEEKIGPLVVVSIKTGAERIQEYGIANHPDFKGRGAKAGAYSKFIISELLPFIDTLALNINGKKGFAGFSLGGLSAFDIVLHHPESFDLAGVFSGSFWWRKKDLKEGYAEEDRIMHAVVRALEQRNEQRFWIMAGTEDEKSDRNNNMIIDSIDDSIDIIKELMLKGYQRPNDIAYYEMVGGKHDVPSWGKAMPAFLEWAFKRH